MYVCMYVFIYVYKSIYLSIYIYIYIYRLIIACVLICDILYPLEPPPLRISLYSVLPTEPPNIPAGSLSGVVLCRFFRGLVFLGLGKKLLLARVLDSMRSDLVHGDGCLVMMFAW